MSGFLPLHRLGTVAVGLNIEGPRPGDTCKRDGVPHFSLVQVIDEPLRGVTFDDVMRAKAARGCGSIEEAAGLCADTFMSTVTAVVQRLQKVYTHLLVHVHQYTGSTNVGTRLAAATGATVILDGTNFFETPVHSYAGYDAVLSLSQCAGLGFGAGSSVGQWIVPSGYVRFEVNTGLLYTTPIPSPSADIGPYVTGVSQGVIAYVDDLWNPSAEDVQQGGVLLLDAQDAAVVAFVRTAMAQAADAAHGMDHIMRVAYAACRQCNTKATLTLALVHDVCDHKLVSGVTRDQLAAFLVSTVGAETGTLVNALVDLVSFSKQLVAREPDAHPSLVAVRDADRADALGHRGLQRCEEVVRSRGGTVPRDVICHALSKLLRLVPEGYITHVTPSIIAAHNVIAAYVRDNIADVAPLL